VSRKNTVRCNVVIAVLAVVSFTGADWFRFRGPGGVGVSDSPDVPVRWSAEENVVWKTALPGFGASSPITLGDRIYLTCYTGYALSQDAPGDQQDLEHVVVCLNLEDGSILWQQSTKAELPEQDYRGFIALHGYASGTPVTDGRGIYVFFGRSGVFGYTRAGRLVWRTSVGSKTHVWGSGTSPIIYKNLVIVNASVESESLVALDKITGKEVWRAEGIRQSWSTPVIVELADGSQELAVSMHSKALGFDPATGKKLWECASVPDYVCPSVIANEGIVYVTGGRRPLTIAIRAGGRGDVTDTHLLWELKKSPKVPTPLYHDGLLYWISNRGIAICVDAKTGEVVYEERLSGTGRVYASPVMAGDKLYAVTRENGTIVLAAGRSFEKLAQNDLGDKSIFNATPVVTGGRLLVRSDRFLYCIGK